MGSKNSKVKYLNNGCSTKRREVEAMELKSAKFEVRRSQVPNAGMGLFARRELPRGTKLKYRGQLMTSQQVEEKYPGDVLAPYTLSFKRFGHVFFVDASETPQHLARYANDSHGTLFIPNAVFRDPDPGRLWPCLYLTRSVKPGEEIFADYGRVFWSESI